jgi:hypothetical protein
MSEDAFRKILNERKSFSPGVSPSSPDLNMQVNTRPRRKFR